MSLRRLYLRANPGTGQREYVVFVHAAEVDDLLNTPGIAPLENPWAEGTPLNGEFARTVLGAGQGQPGLLLRYVATDFPNALVAMAQITGFYLRDPTLFQDEDGVVNVLAAADWCYRDEWYDTESHAPLPETFAPDVNDESTWAWMMAYTHRWIPEYFLAHLETLTAPAPAAYGPGT